MSTAVIRSLKIMPRYATLYYATSPDHLGSVTFVVCVLPRHRHDIPRYRYDMPRWWQDHSRPLKTCEDLLHSQAIQIAVTDPSRSGTFIHSRLPPRSYYGSTTTSPELLRSHYVHTTFILRSHYVHTTFTLRSHYVHTTFTLRSHYVHTTFTLRAHTFDEKHTLCHVIFRQFKMNVSTPRPPTGTCCQELVGSLRFSYDALNVLSRVAKLSQIVAECVARTCRCDWRLVTVQVL